VALPGLGTDQGASIRPVGDGNRAVRAELPHELLQAPLPVRHTAPHPENLCAEGGDIRQDALPGNT